MRGWSYNVLYVYRRTTNDNDDDDDDDDSTPVLQRLTAHEASLSSTEDFISPLSPFLLCANNG